VKPSHAADADASQRVAVISVLKREILRLPRLRPIALSPILKRHLQSDFDRRRAVVGKENVTEARRRDLCQPTGQPHRRRMSHAQQRDMGNFVKLSPNGLVNPWMPMPMDVAPQATHTVEVLPPLDVHERATL